MFYRPHPRVLTPVGEHSMTKQSHKAECDIHNILKQYQKTGIITHIKTQQPTYAELPDSIDYQTSLNTLRAAEDAFASLPSSVRLRYENNPVLFLQALEDPKQLPYLREMGILKPEAAPPAPPAPTPQLATEAPSATS